VNLVADTGKARSRPVRTPATAPDFKDLKWLEDGNYPLDWNGPTGRIFTRIRDEDLDRPIIAHFERVARRHPNGIAVTDSDTSLSFSELWNGLSGLAEKIAARTQPGDLIGIALPACSLFPLAILACLAAGRPFVALDPRYPVHWLGQVLDDARPALIVPSSICGTDRARSAPASAMCHPWKPKTTSTSHVSSPPR